MGDEAGLGFKVFNKSKKGRGAGELSQLLQEDVQRLCPKFQRKNNLSQK